MSEHNETEILSDDQIEEGPASARDRTWRLRLATSQARQDLLMGVRDRWRGDLADSELEDLIDHPDRFVSTISQATGLTRDAVEDELDQMTDR